MTRLLQVGQHSILLVPTMLSAPQLRALQALLPVLHQAFSPSVCLAVMLSRLAKQPSAIQRMHACGALPRLQDILAAQLTRQTEQDLLVDPHCVQASSVVAAEMECLAL